MASICGHTHLDEFRVILDDQQSPRPIGFIHVVPGIDPDHDSNPAYQELCVDAAGNIRDYRTYCLTNFADLKTTSWANFKPEWKLEYSFSTAYPEAYRAGGNFYDTASVNELAEELTHSSPHIKYEFERDYHAGSTRAPAPSDYQAKLFLP